MDTNSESINQIKTVLAYLTNDKVKLIIIFTILTENRLEQML